MKQGTFLNAYNDVIAYDTYKFRHLWISQKQKSMHLEKETFFSNKRKIINYASRTTLRQKLVL